MDNALLPAMRLAIRQAVEPDARAHELTDAETLAIARAVVPLVLEHAAGLVETTHEDVICSTLPHQKRVLAGLIRAQATAIRSAP